ncbi:MAG: ABC transporter substrate-binding protein [Acidimicrobiia bacterium]
MLSKVRNRFIAGALAVSASAALLAISPVGSAGAAQSGSDPTAVLKMSAIVGPSQDPIRATQTCEITTLNTIYDKLFAIGKDGAIEPRLATSYEVRPDNVVRLDLRTGVKFQDNTPFDADAVKFNLDRAMTDPASTIKGFLSSVESVTVVNPTTVDIKMKTPSAGNLLVSLTDRAGMMASPTAVKAAGSSVAFSAAPVGSGMYKVEGTWTARQKLSVRAWDGYWDKSAAKLGGIDFMDVVLGSRANAVATGDVDVAGLDSVAVANTLKGNEDVELITSTSPQYRLFILNETLPPLDNLKVRQAISYAIDRDAIATILTLGVSKAAYQQFPPGNPAYVKALDKMYPYNPTLAKKMLAEAGFPNGFTLQAAVGAQSPTYIQVGEVIQQQLKAVGIDMQFSLIDQATAFANIVIRGQWQASPFGGIVSADPSTDFANHFLTGGSINAGGNEAPGVRALMEEAGASTDAKERAKLYKKANRLVVENVQDGVPLVFDPSLIVIHPYVKGITPGQVDCNFNFRGVSISKNR